MQCTRGANTVSVRQHNWNWKRRIARRSPVFKCVPISPFASASSRLEWIGEYAADADEYNSQRSVRRGEEYIGASTSCAAFEYSLLVDRMGYYSCTAEHKSALLRVERKYISRVAAARFRVREASKCTLHRHAHQISVKPLRIQVESIVLTGGVWVRVRARLESSCPVPICS